MQDLEPGDVVGAESLYLTRWFLNVLGLATNAKAGIKERRVNGLLDLCRRAIHVS